MQVRSWVDDLFQLHTGPKEFIVPHAHAAASTLAKMLVAKKLSISGKSTITASKQAIAIEVHSKLRAEGIDIAVKDSAKDLGVDFCGGRRRILPVQQLRLLNSSTSGRQVSVLGKATKQANRLTITGAKQRFYGYAAMGASPTTQKRMRAVLANAGGYRKAGGCTTTAFALAGLTASDPWVEFPLETIVEFLIAHVNSGMKMASMEAEAT